MMAMLCATTLWAATDPRDDASPWGISSSAEWSSEYPKFNPLISQAGVRWLRLFPEWGSIQPKPGEFKWDGADRIVADARTNNIHISGIFCYFAKFASADGGMRRGPIKDMTYFRDYVAASVARYKNDIRYWEIWNEFNGSFYQGPNKVKEYADLTVAAYDAAKQVDPTCKIGMSVANFDVAFLDAAIKAGASNHFDFVCVHPYENLGTVAANGESGYLSMAGSLRKMLASNHQPTNTPLWITEIGFSAPIKPDPAQDALQAEMVAKGFILSVAQGFSRIEWFEARGPSYGKGTDLSLIRADWSLRPAYQALKTMTGTLGAEPKYLGWWKAGADGYGFVFQGKAGNVLVAWSAPGATNAVIFDAAVRVVDLAGKEMSLAARQEQVLTSAPVFIVGLPEAIVAQAKVQAGKPFPWGNDYSQEREVSIRLGNSNVEKGINQLNPATTLPDTLANSDMCRRLNFKHGSEGRYAYFRVDPTFAPFGTKELEITLVARRIAADKAAGTTLLYESTAGYRSAKGGFSIPAGDDWQEYTWKVDDANFVGQWGWNFRFEATGSPNEFLIREVRVTKTVK